MIPSVELQKDIINNYKESKTEKEFIERLMCTLETFEIDKLDDFDDLEQTVKDLKDKLDDYSDRLNSLKEDIENDISNLEDY